MSLSTQLGKSLPRTREVVSTISRHAATSKYDPTKDFPQTEASNIAPYTLLRKDAAYELRQTTAVGTRDYSKAYKKYENDPTYNLIKEATGYNALASKNIVGDPLLGELTHPYFKQYVRDDAGEATMPNRYKGHITYDELQNILQKADHYFFSERPNPVVQLYIPLEDPRIAKPESALAKAAALVDRLTAAPSEGLISDYAKQTMKSDADLFGFLDEQFESIYKSEANTLQEAKNYKPNSSESNLHKADADLGTLGQYSLTAQQRRAEFWKKYIDLFNYYDVLHTCNVRCTRSVGRVSQTAALVIIGNCHGIFSYGRGKANNYELAVRRALLRTRRNVLFTPLHENRTAYYRHLGTWKKTSLLLIPHRRGVGMRAGRLTFNLLRSVGYKDATLKMLGCRNMWNLVRAWMECLKYQESYREVAFARGSHYQEVMDPFVKNAPAPSREEVQELENAASVAFHDAIQTVFKNRQLLNIESYSDLKPHFELRNNFEQKWEEHLVKKNVPREFHVYPAFSEYLDAVGSISDVYKRIQNENLLEQYVADEFAGYTHHKDYKEYLAKENEAMEEINDRLDAQIAAPKKATLDMYAEYEKPITVAAESKYMDPLRLVERLDETFVHVIPSHDNVSAKDKKTIMDMKLALRKKLENPSAAFDRTVKITDQEYIPEYNKNYSKEQSILLERVGSTIEKGNYSQEEYDSLVLASEIKFMKNIDGVASDAEFSNSESEREDLFNSPVSFGVDNLLEDIAEDTKKSVTSKAVEVDISNDFAEADKMENQEIDDELESFMEHLMAGHTTPGKPVEDSLHGIMAATAGDRSYLPQYDNLLTPEDAVRIDNFVDHTTHEIQMDAIRNGPGKKKRVL